MYEFHGWFGISEDPYEDDPRSLRAGVEELRARIGAVQWSASCKVVLDRFNGLDVVTVVGHTNHRGAEAGQLDDLVAYIARRFPGSWGCSTTAPTKATSRTPTTRSGCASCAGGSSRSGWIRSSRRAIR